MKKLLSRFVVLILCVALIPCFGLSTVEKVIRPIGDTSRKNPLLIGETVITENNMYDEYTYSYTVEYKEVVRDKNAVRVNLIFSLSKCSDGVDREIRLWNTDFQLFDSDYSQIDSMSYELGTLKTGTQPSGAIPMFPETSSDVVITFKDVPDGILYLRFNPMNSYYLEDVNVIKSAVWFAIEP